LQIIVTMFFLDISTKKEIECFMSYRI
jgi:hypothetical protein